MFDAQLRIPCEWDLFLRDYGTIVHEDDTVDKIRVDSTWQHVHMQTFHMLDQGFEVDLLVHTKSRQSCVYYRAAMFNDRTYKKSK